MILISAANLVIFFFHFFFFPFEITSNFMDSSSEINTVEQLKQTPK